MLNSREWAILIWLVFILIWLLSRRSSRQALDGVVRSFRTPKILVPVGLLFGYVGFEIWLGSMLSLWLPELIKETIAWFLVTGFALFVDFDKVSTERHYFRKRIAAALGIVVFLEFFTNMFVLNLAAELLLQPFIFVLAILAAVAAIRQEHRAVKLLAEGLLAVVFLALLVYNVQQVIVNWDGIDASLTIRQVVLPMWMTVGLLPFVYLMSLYANYEMAFVRMGSRNQDRRRGKLRAMLALMVGLHFRTKIVNHFGSYWGNQAVKAPSFRAALEVVRNFRRSEEEKMQAVKEEQNRLKRNAGIDGEDEDGRRLDRREFKETTDALRWLATCQMGWHRNRGGRYRRRIIKFLDAQNARRGLPEEHGVTMKVREDGEAWYAWRRTVTGWCFATGAGGPPPDQWEYDGPEPPGGFPGEDPAWGDRPFSFDENRNW